MTATPNGSAATPVSAPVSSPVGSPMSPPVGAKANPAANSTVSDIDGMRFRSVLGRFATGVVAITAIDQETAKPTGLAANSFTSVSLDPPLVAFCVAHTSSTWPRLRVADRLCINILSELQLDVCRQLSMKGGDKFATIDWTTAPGGSPVIKEALAWIECTVESEYPAGDHMIIVARVHHLDKHHEGEPLLFYQGAYGRFDG
ncbi:flavin reductase family protein [Actinomadura scrupuli]|uniref:flavin reductase family protein n=1 Tax=Actinomadura scrupuli TaxID=559629 RepID=UPI003D976657